MDSAERKIKYVDSCSRFQFKQPISNDLVHVFIGVFFGNSFDEMTNNQM